MKQLILTISVVALIFLNTGCNSNPNEKITTAFNNKYPEAQKVEWEQEEENIWEAEFEMNGNEFTACFNTNGEWLETEMDFELSKLPDTVRQTISMNYEGFEIDEAEWIETPDFKGFAIEIEKDKEGEKELELFITKEGKLIKVEEEDDHDHDADDDHDDDEGHDHDDDED